jgi:signal transduction histidine kinase
MWALRRASWGGGSEATATLVAYASKARRGRRRAVLGAAIVLAALAVSLSILAVRQVSGDAQDFLDGKKRDIEQHLSAGLAALEVLEAVALRDIEGGPVETERLRGIEDRHLIAGRAFVLSGSRVEWPAGPEGAGAYARALWSAAPDTPLSRRLFSEAYVEISRGDAVAAIASLERILPRQIPPAARCEGEFLLASLLARDSARSREAAPRYDTVLALAAPEGKLDRDLLPWALAARFQKALFLAREEKPREEARALLEILSDLTGEGAWQEAESFTSYYMDRVLEALSNLEAGGKLSEAERERLAILRARVERTLGETAFRSEMETLWIPSVQAAGGEGRPGPRHAYAWTEEGPAVLTFQRDGAAPDKTVGFLVELAAVRAQLLRPPSGASGNISGPLRVMDEQGRVVLSGTAADGEREGTDPSDARWQATVAVALGGDLPWTLEMPVGGALAKFRWRRGLVYGAAAALAFALIALATFATLRAMSRQVEVAELKSEFVANVSHELKTPLTLIKMFTDMLLLGYSKDPEERERSLEVIARETENLGLLIENVLDISRIEAGEKEYRPAPEDLGPLVSQVLEEYGQYLQRKGFSMRLDAEPGLPLLDLDRTAVAQALRNLLSNAAKYSGDRKEIEVRVWRDGRHAAVAVADRGAGIDPGEARHLFERFYRGRKAGAAGAGLGLALVKHAVEAHGGAVSAAAREGGGAVFTMCFPLPPGEPDSKPPPVNESPPAHEPDNQGANHAAQDDPDRRR